LQGGARASGRTTGALVENAPADLIVLCDDDPMLLGHSDDSRLDALVFSGYPLPLERVMVAGEWRVVDAVHVEQQNARREFGASLEIVRART